MQRLNCWEHADALTMAVRLRRAGTCPRDVDNLFGELVESLVHMATALLVTGSKYRTRIDELMSFDVQQTMFVHCLAALDRDCLETADPKKVVNYLVKTVQNRLRNYVRDTSNRDSKLTVVSESVLGCDMAEAGPVSANLDGEKIYRTNNSKVVTRPQKEH